MRSEETVAGIVPPGIVPHSSRRGFGSDPFCLLDMKEDSPSPGCSWQSFYVHEENQPQDEANAGQQNRDGKNLGLDDVPNLLALPLSRGEAG